MIDGLSISVVIPVYNEGSRIRDLFRMMRSQTYRNAEFIFVDDGSTDDTAAALGESSGTDERITVIRQINAGPASARNAGIGHAKGEYVCFVDADDEIPPTFVEHLAISVPASRPDIVLFGYEKIGQNGATLFVRKSARDDSVSVERFVEGLFEDKFAPSVWSKLFKRSVFDRALFRSGWMIGEELVLYADLIKSGGFSCASIEYCAYRYRVNEGSLMNRFDLKLERQQLLSWDMLCDVARGFFPSLTRDGGFAQARMRLAFLDKLITKGLERTSDYEQVSWWLKENRSTVFGNSRFSLGRRASFEVFLVCPPLYRLLVKRRFSWQEK